MKFRQIYDERHPNKEIWASLLVYCPYKAYLKNVMPRKSKKNAFMLAGRYIHEAIEEDLAEFFETEKRIEVNLGDGWKLAGRVDLFDPIEKSVIEIKTASKRGVKDEWIEQANLYAYLLDCPKFEIWIVLIPTGEIDIKEFSMDKKKAEELIEIAKRVSKGEKICKREYCNWCEYSDICDNDTDEESFIYL